MKIKVIIEITGDFEDDLPDEEVKHILREVINNGAEMNYLNGNVEILEIIEK